MTPTMERRTLVRLLVGLGIGIPVVVEALTLLGLVDAHFFADERGTPTPAPRSVGVGDELLVATPQSETVTDAAVSAGARWTLVVDVEVENTGPVPYELRLGPVTTGGGVRVEGGASTGRVASGATVTVTGRWDLPRGTTPRSVDVVALEYVEGGPRTTSETVLLGRVPVQG